MDAVIDYGIEEADLDDSRQIICTEDGKAIQLDNMDMKTRLLLQLDENEIDDYLKIYTNYVRVDDKHGDWHYDLYFNIQNLFNPPFEYISSITHQPNVLVLPDSYLRLSGDKFKKVYDENGVWTHNEIDPEKVEQLKKGGKLSLYGQIKAFSNDRLVGVRLVKLFTYTIHNISDDKPKFLIEKTFDITKSSLTSSEGNPLKIEFSDVMWQMKPEWYEDDQFKVLKEDVVVVQPVKIHYDWSATDDNRISRISFDIVNDMIDFDNCPELCGYDEHVHALKRWDGESTHTHYDRWSDRCMELKVDPTTKIPRMTLTWDEGCGYNFETVYLKWRVPKGFNAMDIMDRLQGYAFSSTAENVVVDCHNPSSHPMEIVPGRIVMRVPKKGEMYLGLEHSTTHRKNGFVLKGLASTLKEAIGKVVSESEMKTNAQNREVK